MSTHKAQVDAEKLSSFLQEKFSGKNSLPELLPGGESSQAFGFSASGKEYVIRVSKHSDESFKKDAYAHQHFGSVNLPIPKIIEIGTLDDQFFAISEKVQGKWVQDLTKEEYEKVLPDLMAKLEAIHSADIAGTQGYGKWNGEGEGKHNTWKEFILSLGEYADGFPEKDVWERIYSRIEELVELCPEERYLVHGDYGYDNVLSDGQKITGVIDWGEGKYGDPLYDVAWMNFWAQDYSPLKDFNQFFRKHQENRGITYTNFEARVRCYELNAGLLATSFYAYSNQKDKYEFGKERTLRLI
ncbi:MAG: phosphotransferase [Candidatus Paceibacterota bacterium]